MTTAIIWQLGQIFVMLALSPLITGYVRFAKARLNGRRGPAPWQPYRELWRLLQKETLLPIGSSWIFRAAPYVTLASVWCAAAIIPTFSTQLALTHAADMVALVALLAVGRFWTALAGLDVGTSFGGMGASREMLIASLAEPAMLMVTFSVSLVVGSTQPTAIVAYVLAGKVGLEVSLGLALAAMIMVAVAECGRIPIDNPATHLELTMVHEAMTLEYSGRHLAMFNMAGMLRLNLFISLIACLFLPFGMAPADASFWQVLLGGSSYLLKVAGLATALAFFETMLAKMRVFRYADFLGGALLLGLLATIFLYVSEAV